MTAGKKKPESQWTGNERKAANLDQRLKSLIMSVLPDDQMNFIINCLTAKSIWDDLILYHEGPSDVKESRAIDLKLCYNSFKYKEDFQDSPDDEEYTRSSQEYLNDLEEEYQERALLAKSKRFFKKGSQRFSSAKASEDTICHKCGRKGLVAEAYEWDEEDVSSDDNDMTEVKVLMAPTDDENVTADKESARNGEWVKISMRKVHTLLDIILPAESQVKITDPIVAITNSSANEYDSTNESSVCSTPLSPLVKLAGAGPISGPKTINPAKGNKNVSASKRNSTPISKPKNVKIEDDIPLSISDIKKSIWYLDSGCSRHMTGVKNYLHKYVEQPGPKVVFGDDSTCITEGYGSIKCNEPYEEHEPFVLETDVSLDQNDQTDKNDYSAQVDEILNDDHPEHSNHNNDEPIIENLTITEDVQNPEPLSSLAEGALVSNTIPLLTNPSLSIPSMASPAPQDKWS
ncbi:hypothetical protein Tco_0413764 [Tanacetum coccineum]